MVIKSYVAPSVAGALKMIRAELGSKAVVLKTRGLSVRESGVGRRMVEITACLEKPTVGALSASLSDAPAMTDRTTTLSAHGNTQSSANNTPDSDAAARIPKRGIQDNRQSNLDESSDLVREDSARDDSVKGDYVTEERMDMRDATEQFRDGERRGMIDIRDLETFASRLEEKLDLILDSHVSAETITEVPAAVAPIARALTAQDIPEHLLRPLLKRINEKGAEASPEQVLQIAEEALVSEFAAHSQPSLNLRSGDVALFVGPVGSGKTSVLGKVAVDLLFKKKIRTELSTLDDFRIAAQEEIASYGEALGAEYIDPEEINHVRGEINRKAGRTLLVDCHSNISDQRQFVRLKERANALRPTAVFLVVSALTRSSDLTRLLRRFAHFNPTHLIVTHTDLTDTLGGVYTAALESGLKLCALTNSPGSIGDLLPPDPAAMARRILERSH